MVTGKGKCHSSSNSSNVKYLVTFKRCGLQYVGETGQPLHLRVNGHQNGITHQKTKESPVVEHFNSRVHEESDMAVMAIELTESHDMSTENTRSRWTRTLESSSPSAMNTRVDSL